LVKAAAPPMLTESPSGERAEGDPSAQLAVAPPAIPRNERGTWTYRRGGHGYKLQLGKAAPDHDRFVAVV